MASLGVKFTLQLLVVLASVSFVQGQDCYFPNGDVSIEGDAQCSSTGGTCCPMGWECLSNGLCYLANQNYYGRYTCTDQTWQSQSCPQICTEGNTAVGNEALLQCADGSWCCDGDRSWNCCTKAGTNYFDLPQGVQIALVLSAPSPTHAGSVHNGAPSTSDATPVGQSNPASMFTSDVGTASPTMLVTSSSAAAAESASPMSSANAPATSTVSSQVISQFTTASVISGSNGVSTVISVLTETMSPTAGAASGSSSSKLNLRMIVGLAVGVPVFLTACALLAFCLLKRRRNKGRSRLNKRRDQHRPEVADMYHPLAPDGTAPELDGTPRASGRTNSGRNSELPGSIGFGHSPALSTGTAGITPPEYSPMIQQEPQELWGGSMPDPWPRAELPGERRVS